MTRWFGVVSVCVLAAVIVVPAYPSAQGGGAGRGAGRGGGGGGSAPNGQGGQQNPEVQQAREAMQRDVAEGKRLQQQLKIDRQMGDREGARHDNDALKMNREKVKQDQARVRQLVQGRGAGRGRE